MKIIPSLIEQATPRPAHSELEAPYLIPNDTHSNFWNKVYQQLSDEALLSPVLDSLESYINPDHGYFGIRTHPIDESKPYFHIGIELSFHKSQNLTPIANGVLEYSGYGAINGHYVLISHPQIQTQDDYVLHSMYCHLKKPLVSFNSYQKMLREISLGSYPSIPIALDQIIGLAGSSGVVQGQHPRSYLQIDFRKYGQTPIVLDPLRIIGNQQLTNKSAKQFPSYLQ